MNEAVRVAVLTQIPSPYQIELFDAVQSAGTVSVTALYLDRVSSKRAWRTQEFAHQGIVLDSAHAVSAAEGHVESADLVVFGDYTYRQSRRLLSRRSVSGRPWCFWAERPGVRLKGRLGALARRLTLATLHRAAVPIWGIGQWAVDGYRAEFGNGRRYFNVPYFSDLRRFFPAGVGDRTSGPPRRILFSGALIRRKGVDLLAAAFARVARDHPGLELSFLGAGPMRPHIESALAPHAGRVHFHGFKDWSDLPDYYRQNDILCVPSRYDGWGLVVPEGLAAGMPVIATSQMGAARELIVDGENGWLVDAGSVRALTGALMQAATLTPERWSRMREAAARSVGRHQLADGVRRFEDAALQSRDGRA